MTYARDHVFERSAVQDERVILQAAMDRSMGQASSRQMRRELDRRVEQGECRTVQHGPHVSAPAVHDRSHHPDGARDRRQDAGREPALQAHLTLWFLG